jgi:hypothetical protein
MVVTTGRRRAIGIALIALTFAVAAVESGLALGADAALPLWDKPMHAVGAFALALAVTPTPRWRSSTLVAVVGVCVAWEVIQFIVDPYQGHAPLAYALDTLTDLAADVAGALVAFRRGGPPTRDARDVDPRLAVHTT